MSECQPWCDCPEAQARRKGAVLVVDDSHGRDMTMALLMAQNRDGSIVVLDSMDITTAPKLPDHFLQAQHIDVKPEEKTKKEERAAKMKRRAAAQRGWV